MTHNRPKISVFWSVQSQGRDFCTVGLLTVSALEKTFLVRCAVFLVYAPAGKGYLVWLQPLRDGCPLLVIGASPFSFVIFDLIRWKGKEIRSGLKMHKTIPGSAALKKLRQSGGFLPPSPRARLRIFGKRFSPIPQFSA